MWEIPGILNLFLEIRCNLFELPATLPSSISERHIRMAFYLQANGSNVESSQPSLPRSLKTFSIFWGGSNSKILYLKDTILSYVIVDKCMTNANIIEYTRKNQYICVHGQIPQTFQRWFLPLYQYGKIQLGLKTIAYQYLTMIVMMTCFSARPSRIGRRWRGLRGISL